ncbi:MAG: hypothetical protein LIO97_03505 [Tannerellaceae bacterium]|nr:hypothetical protein [Tannerellaceae bacterium]
MIIRGGTCKFRSLVIILLSVIVHGLLSTGHATKLSVFVENFSVDDYKASCQNWKLAISPDGLLYVANNIGLLTYDGNSWWVNPLPDNSVVTSVTFSKDTIFTLSDTNLFGGWLRDEKGIPHFIPLDYMQDDLEFELPPVHLPFPLPGIIQQSLPSVIEHVENLYFFGTSTNGLFITDEKGNILQHLSLQNQLNDNIVRDICIQDQNQIWLALDNGLARIALNPSVALLGQRSQIGRLTDAALVNDTIYVQTHIPYRLF